MPQHVIEVDVRPAYLPRVDAAGLRRAVECTLASRRLRAPRALSIWITNTRSLRRLNRRYAGDDAPTDVLSFDLGFPGLKRPDGVRELGAVAVALPVAARGARARGVSLHDELALLVTHGLLHLLGFDHRTGVEDQRMRAAEARALQLLGRPKATRAAIPRRKAT